MARPVPEFIEDPVGLGKVVSVIGKALLEGAREYAAAEHLKIDGFPDDPNADVPVDQVVAVLRTLLADSSHC